jgi:transposase InsO family protein
MDEQLQPKDRAEAIALFRSEVIGALTRRDLSRGELRAELRALSRQRFRPPRRAHTRTYGVSTLERWYYRYRSGGLAALRPAPRGDRGRGRDLPQVLVDLLLDIRREHPSAGVPLILRTLVADGRMSAGAVSATTVRRLYRDQGLDRVPLRDGHSAHTRLRWQADRPNALWHGDVCYGPSLHVDGGTLPLRIHGLLDDASRYFVALEAHHREREDDLLGVLLRALRRHGAPEAFYLDNGSTYRGAPLRLACERLGITLIHAQPRDPEARGKMERVWRTLREGCLDHLGAVTSLHDVNVRLWAWLDQHYHHAPHGSLFGQTPAQVYHAAADLKERLSEEQLRDALTLHVRRRVRRDTTFDLAGRTWELDQGFLAGRVVTVGYSLYDPDAAPWVVHEQQRLAVHPVDPATNAHRPRPSRRPRLVPPPEARHVPFDPPGALLNRELGRTRKVPR